MAYCRKFLFRVGQSHTMCNCSFKRVKKCNFEIRTFFAHFCTFAHFERGIVQSHFLSHFLMHFWKVRKKCNPTIALFKRATKKCDCTIALFKRATKKCDRTITLFKWETKKCDCTIALFKRAKVQKCVKKVQIFEWNVQIAQQAGLGNCPFWKGAITLFEEPKEFD